MRRGIVLLIAFIIILGFTNQSGPVAGGQITTLGEYGAGGL